MIISLNTLRNSTCPNLWHNILSVGKQIGANVEIQDEVANKIISKCNSPVLIEPTGIRPEAVIPYEEWPLALRLFASAASKPSDTGLGDIVERIVGPIGGEEFKKWYKTIFGKDCGCGQRKQWLNGRYPLKSN